MKEDQEEHWIERRIVTGLIVSTEFIQTVLQFWQDKLLSSAAAKKLASWCLEYYNSYNRAPNTDIEGIYTQKLKEGLDKDEAEDIELILQGLSTEYEREQFNVQYLLDQTRTYFERRHLELYIEDIRSELVGGTLTEAEKLANSYTPLAKEQHRVVDPFTNPTLIKEAFADQQNPLLRFGKALGRFWNDQLTRESFVALMGPEKRGKTFWLIEFAMHGLADGCNVAFFQAGDLSERQLILRLCVYLANRSNKAKYCVGMYVPVVDCINNQTGRCPNSQSKQAPFEPGTSLKDLSKEVLVNAFISNPGYIPCHNCNNEPRIGSLWFKWRDEVDPLDAKTAWTEVKRWRKHHRKNFKLCTYPNETLMIQEIRALLDIWERTENFIPDIIIVDYADILAPDPDCRHLDHRNQQNKIWQRLRRLSQERRCLVLTATQAAASSYTHETLRLSDFSEDKRKYAHVTAMYGLNQTDEEKRIGLMRINEMVVREGDFERASSVYVLQRLQIGRPYLGSFK